MFSGTRTGITTNKGYIHPFTQLWGTRNIESTEPYCSAGKNLAFRLTQGYGGCGNSYTETDGDQYTHPGTHRNRDADRHGDAGTWHG